MLLGFVLLVKLGKRNAVVFGLSIRIPGGVVMEINISKQTILIGGVMAGLAVQPDSAIMGFKAIYIYIP